jgi:hypothetical protein
MQQAAKFKTPNDTRLPFGGGRIVECRCRCGSSYIFHNIHYATNILIKNVISILFRTSLLYNLKHGIRVSYPNCAYLTSEPCVLFAPC